ncbi:hypothetical protein BD779DRAFT_1772141 [Infundibulicybe gibba]|nr:hypothetical protein BD779DRAFT_1772141 [Infundibulicybe gibba]
MVMQELEHHRTECADHSFVYSDSVLGGSPCEGGRLQPTDERNVRQSEPGKGETKEPLECGCTRNGRALVVCLDGTSNQFGRNNTNVIELYDRIVKSENQLTYYNSGIGTYAKPSWRSFTY